MRHDMTMRKLLPTALVAAILVTATAFAAGQLNTYQVAAKTSPTTAGTTKHPVPISLSFSYTVGETNNQRPAVVQSYAIQFNGVRVTTKGFATCSAAKINAAQSNSVCPAAAKVGGGTIKNQVGPASDPSNKAASCTLTLTLYNAANNHATLYIGAPTPSSPPEQCAGVTLHNGIDATYIRNSAGTTLRFVVPQSLLHPIPGIDNAVTFVSSKINKVTKGKTVYYASVGGCHHKQRAVTVTFTQEDGTQRKAQTFATCK